MPLGVPQMTQREILASQIDPEHVVHRPFDSGFDIFEDDGSRLTDLNSEQAPAPTKYQTTNDDSIEAVGEPDSVFDVPFDYSWVKWNDISLRGYTAPLKYSRGRAWFWKFGVPLAIARYDEEGHSSKRRYYLCRTCHLDGSRYRARFDITRGTSAVRSHFRTVHPTTYNEETMIPSINQPTTSDALELLNTSDPKQQSAYNQMAEVFDLTALRKDILRWVILDNIPYKKVDSPNFWRILLRRIPFIEDKTLPSRNSIRRWVLKEYVLHKQELQKTIDDSLGRVHISFDVWTSRRRRALNGVTGHWVDRRGHCRTALLSIKEMADIHSGENLCKNVLDTINEYSLRDRIGYFVTDNAAPNDTALKELGEELGFNPSWRRLRCAGHIINLIATQVLYGKDFEMFEEALENAETMKEETALWRSKGPVGMVHTIVQWINKSAGRVQRFNKVQSRLGRVQNYEGGRSQAPLALLMSNATRWNSTYDMLVRAQRLRASIEEYLEDERATYRQLTRKRLVKPLHEKSEQSLTRVIFQNGMGSDDWAVVSELITILEPFKQATKWLEARPNENSAADIAEVVPTIKVIMEELEKLKIQYAESQKDTPFWTAIEQAWGKAREYYIKFDDTPVYATAILLNPRLKKAYLRKEWGGAWADHSVKMVEKLYKDEYETQLSDPPELLPASQSSQGSTQPLRETSLNTPRLPKKRKFVHISDKIEDTKRFSPPSQVENELDVYLREPQVIDPDLIPAQYWWRVNVRARFPTLSLMAIELLPIPPMSSEPERIFSQGGLTLSSGRARLSENSLEACLCLAHWGKSGLIQIGDHHQELRGTQEAVLDSVFGKDGTINLSESEEDSSATFREEWEGGTEEE